MASAAPAQPSQREALEASIWDILPLVKKGCKTEQAQVKLRAAYAKTQALCNADPAAPVSAGAWKAVREAMRTKPGLMLDFAAGEA